MSRAAGGEHLTHESAAPQVTSARAQPNFSDRRKKIRNNKNRTFCTRSRHVWKRCRTFWIGYRHVCPKCRHVWKRCRTFWIGYRHVCPKSRHVWKRCRTFRIGCRMFCAARRMPGLLSCATGAQDYRIVTRARSASENGTSMVWVRPSAIKPSRPPRHFVAVPAFVVPARRRRATFSRIVSSSRLLLVPIPPAFGTTAPGVSAQVVAALGAVTPLRSPCGLRQPESRPHGTL